LNAVVWTIVAQTTGTSLEVENWESTYGVIMNFSRAFLLVFRLNRAADRFWQSRAMWGRIVAVSRYLVSTILVHTSHAPEPRNQAVVWIGALAVSTMHFLRRETSIPCDELAGFCCHLMKLKNCRPLFQTAGLSSCTTLCFRSNTDSTKRGSQCNRGHTCFFSQRLEPAVVSYGGISR
jgi:hypothetical protein